MSGKLRKALVTIGTSAAIGFVVSGLVHAEFEAMKRVLYFGALISFCLFIARLFLGATGGNRVARILGRLAVVCALAVPLAFVASPIVFRVELWNAKRYVRSDLAAALERERSRTGMYPKEWRPNQSRPPGTPWLVRRFTYFSNGQEYHLFVMNPAVCGHEVSYRSSTKEWSETYDPCWY